MSFSPVVDIKDGAQGPPGIGIIMQGDATVAELNAIDTNTLEEGYAWVMLDSGQLTSGSQPLDVDAGDLAIWTADGHWVKLVVEAGPQGPPGTPGEDGTDGFSPFIDVNNFWNDKDGNTGVPATGPQGPPGVSATIVGYFGDVATPADLPADGILPVDFDGPGRPSAPYTMGSSTGTTEGLFYQHPDGPNSPEYGEVWVWFPNDAVWSNIGRIVGPEGPAGPQGPIGPEGPQGPPGETVRIVGYFGDVRTPAELPPNGFIPADWDGPGRPSIDIQMEDGWALFYQAAGGPSDPEYGEVWGWASDGPVWLNLGQIVGPQGEPGPQGPAGPTAVSADPGNAATLGSDSLIWVPQSGGGSGNFEVGMIMPFYGVTIPTGWALCDGSTYNGNPTPDLRDKFVISSGPTYPTDTTGGAIPAPTTSGAAGAHGHNVTVTAGGDHGHAGSSAAADGAHSHNLTIEEAGAHTHAVLMDPHQITNGQLPTHSHKLFNATGQGDNAPNIGSSSVASAGFNDGGEGNRYLIKDISSSAASLGVSSEVGLGQNIGHSGDTNSMGNHTHAGSVAASSGSHTHSVTVANGGSHSHSASADNEVDHTHSIPAVDLPPYYSIRYIMFVGTA